MQMVQQRKEGVNSQEPSTSGGLTWADLGQLRASNRNQVRAAFRTELPPKLTYAVIFIFSSTAEDEFMMIVHCHTVANYPICWLN